MLREIVSIGDKIEIKQVDKNGDTGLSKTYVSQVVDFFEDDNMLSIATPIRRGTIVILQKLEDYRLCFYTTKGLYQCDCKMIHTYRENNMILALIKPITRLEKIQRREYFRLECIHEIKYRLITEEEIELEEKLLLGKFSDDEKNEIKRALTNINKDWLIGSVIDLSGGGFRFTSELKLTAEDLIRIKLDYIIKGETSKLDVMAEIIASRKIENRVGVYEHRAKFYNIKEKDREYLIKYIFEQERKLRRYDKNNERLFE